MTILEELRERLKEALQKLNGQDTPEEVWQEIEYLEREIADWEQGEENA